MRIGISMFFEIFLNPVLCTTLFAILHFYSIQNCIFAIENLLIVGKSCVCSHIKLFME